MRPASCNDKRKQCMQHASVGVAPLLRPQTSQLLTRLAGHSNTDIARFIMNLCGLISLRSPPPDPSAGAALSPLTPPSPQTVAESVLMLRLHTDMCVMAMRLHDGHIPHG